MKQEVKGVSADAGIISALRDAVERALGFRLGNIEAERIALALADAKLAITPTDAPFQPLVMFRETDVSWEKDVIAQIEFKPGVYHVIHRIRADYQARPEIMTDYLPHMLAVKLVSHQEGIIAEQIAQSLETQTRQDEG